MEEKPLDAFPQFFFSLIFFAPSFLIEQSLEAPKETGIKSEILLNFLSENNIFVSSSSACTGNSKSHVLTAVNLPENRIESAIRISFSIFNSVQDINKLCEFIKKAQKNLII